MKATIFSMLMLVLAATSFGSGEITLNFEGSDVVGMNGGAIVEGYATTGTHSYMVEKGGWGPACNFNDSAAIKTALATVGTIKFDVTTANFPQSWGDLGLFMQGGGSAISGYWGINNWVGGLSIGTTQSFTIQLTAAQMAQVAGSDWWFQVGIGVNAPGAVAAIPPVIDDFTGEILVPGVPAVTPTFYFDNIQIVPEPATLILLGLGALATLKRRKA